MKLITTSEKFPSNLLECISVYIEYLHSLEEFREDESPNYFEEEKDSPVENNWEVGSSNYKKKNSNKEKDEGKVVMGRLEGADTIPKTQSMQAIGYYGRTGSLKGRDTKKIVKNEEGNNANYLNNQAIPSKNFPKNDEKKGFSNSSSLLKIQRVKYSSQQSIKEREDEAEKSSKINETEYEYKLKDSSKVNNFDVSPRNRKRVDSNFMTGSAHLIMRKKEIRSHFDKGCNFKIYFPRFID